VWNEQNLDREWTSTRGLVAANYVELLGTTIKLWMSIQASSSSAGRCRLPASTTVYAWDDFIYLDQPSGRDAELWIIGAHHNGYNIGRMSPIMPNDPTATFRAVRQPAL
jgi:hypothetical protein